MHLLLFLSPDWLTLCHMVIFLINSLFFLIYFLFLSDEGPMLETLDYTIHIGSTPTVLYLELYLYSAYVLYVPHYVYQTDISIHSILLIEVSNISEWSHAQQA